VSKLDTIFEEEYQTALESLSSVHEQDDGVILSVCCTGTSSRDSLVSWIQFLVKNNPRLGTDIPILFTLKSPIGPTDDLEIPSFEVIHQKL
jgi:signaling intermediate in Toll pathway protein